MKLNQFLLIGVLFFISVSPLSAKYSLESNTTLLPKEPSVIEGELANGFKYSIMKNKKPKHRAELRLLVKAGSIDEDDDQKGIAHFVEHMAFNGTKHFKANELIDFLESLGVRFGSHLNASTGFERTLYQLTIPLEKDNLEKGMLVFEDWASGLSFNKDELEKERGVVLEEKRKRNSMGYRLYMKSRSLYFGNSRFFQRPTIGDEKIIQNIGVERVKDFYDDWYRPELMHFVAVGDFNVTKVEASIKKHFSHLKNRNHKPTKSRKIAQNNTTRIKFFTDKELTSNSLTIFYMDKMEPNKRVSDVRRGLVESIMIRLFNLKAKEQLLKKDPKATSISFGDDMISSQRGAYTFSASFRNGNDLGALEELYGLIWSFKKYGFSKSEMALVKEEMLANNENAYKQVHDKYSSSLASSLVFYARHTDNTFIDYDFDYNLTKELIPTITIEEVNREFKRVVGIKDRAILFTNTTGDSFTKDKVLKTIKKAESRAEDFTKVKLLPKEILEKKLEPKKILSKQYNKKDDIYHFVLENGINVYFKPTDFTKNNVSLTAFSFGGTSLYDVDELDNVKKATGFILASGAGKFSTIDLSKILADKDIGVSTSISKFTESIGAGANSKDLKSMFELLYLKITQPKIDETIAHNRKKELQEDVEEVLKNPFAHFNRELQLFYNKNNPRIFFDTNASIEKLDSSKMLEIYRDRFSDMNNFTFVIVGDTTVEKLEPLLATYLGNLPTKERKESFKHRVEPQVDGKHTFTRDYNNENITETLIHYRSNLAYSNRTNMKLAAMTDILSTRLRKEIREKMSAVYGIGVSFNIKRLDRDETEITISFSSDPKRANEVVKAVELAIEKLKKDGVTKEELDIYKKKFDVSHETAMRENSYWSYKIKSALKYNSSLEYEMHSLPKLVHAITPKEIKELSKSTFSKNLVIAQLKPKR